MITASDIIILDISKQDILNSIEKALKENFIDNLRDRAEITSFDSKVRGNIGEIGIKKWLKSNNINSSSPELDSNKNKYHSNIDLLIRGIVRDYNAEIKTSLKPDNWHEDNIKEVLLRDCINKGDIKIFKTKTLNDIDRDIYIQVYFGFKRKEHDEELKKKHEKNPQVLIEGSISDIYNYFEYYKYIENTFFVAWIDKQTLIKKLEQLPESERFYQMEEKDRGFWKCEIRNSLPPQKLIAFLKAMKNYI